MDNMDNSNYKRHSFGAGSLEFLPPAKQKSLQNKKGKEPVSETDPTVSSPSPFSTIHKRGESRVGAFHEAPGEELRRVSLATCANDNNEDEFDDVERNTTMDHPNHNQNLNSNDNHDGLVQAVPVPLNEHDADNTDEDNVVVSQAQPVDLEAARQRKERRTKQFLVGLAFTVVALVLLLVIIVVGVIISKNKQLPKQGILTNSTSTVAPTVAPTTRASELLQQLLPPYTVKSLSNSSSPQSMAFDWVLVHPNFTSMAEWRKRQLFAMATFYYAFEGPNWNDYDPSTGGIAYGWLNASVHECDWYPKDKSMVSGQGEYGSVEQDFHLYEFNNPEAGTPLPICNDLNQLTLLSLQGLALSQYAPTIPPEISLLTSLNTIYLYGNDINTTLDKMISTEMSQLSNLTTLRLDYNYIQGLIPQHVGSLRSLQELDLAANAVNSTIPSELGLLTSLQKLHLYVNWIEGPIPSELGQLTKLSRLSLRGNQLSNSVPSELGHLNSLHELFLYDNFLSHVIPTELGLLSGLEHFYAFNNLLTGLPSEVGMMSNLRVLHLFENELVGALPTDLGHLSQLVSLSVHQNLLNSTLPTELGLLSSLQSFFLYNNSFTGKVPTELGALPNINYLFLNNNKLSGWIPSELGSIPSLEGQDAYFQSGIPPGLRSLHMHNNNLTGSIPSELGVAFSISPYGAPRQLFLSYNALEGKIPSELGLASNLSHIMFNNNALTGSIPSDFGRLSLQKLDFSYNHLTGSIPPGLQVRTSFNISGNNMTGTISEKICSLNQPSCFDWESQAPCLFDYDCSAVLCGCYDCPCELNNRSDVGASNTSSWTLSPNRNATRNELIADAKDNNIFAH